jgi:cytochrome c oxidase subunit 2
MDRGTFWLPPQLSTTAGEIDALFYFIYWASIVFAVGVGVATVWLAWKYRRTHAAHRGERVKENAALETTWIVIPTLLVLVVFFWGFKAYVDTVVAPADAYEINVQARMWGWDFYYDDGTVTQDLHVPEGMPVKLILNSTDVLHSFYVPDFRIKHDVIPNRYSYVWFETVDGLAGDSVQILCTEYCGTGHSNMGAQIYVHSVEDFWAGEWKGGIEPTDSPVAIGAKIYEAQGCQTCHATTAERKIGPGFGNNWGQPRPGSSQGVVNEDYVRESIVNPQAYIVEGYPGVMPAYPALDDLELYALTAYIKDLNGESNPATFAETGLLDEEGVVAGDDAAGTDDATDQ